MTLKILLSLYILIGVVTFGHAYNRDYTGYTSDAPLMASLIYSAAWPLYWSEVFWKDGK